MQGVVGDKCLEPWILIYAVCEQQKLLALGWFVSPLLRWGALPVTLGVQQAKSY